MSSGIDTSLEETTSSEEKVKKRVISINGKNYAVGLFWQPLQNPKNAGKEIEDFSNTLSEKAVYYALRGKEGRQYGLSFKDSGHNSGMPVATAMLANNYVDKRSVLAVFKINEGYWYTSIRNDLILPEEDSLFISEDAAKNSFMTMLTAVPDWDLIIAPADWQIPTSIEVALEEILKNQPEVKLTPVKPPLNILFILAAVVILAGGYYFYDKKVQNDRAIARRQQEEAERAEREAKIRRDKEKASWQATVDSFSSEKMQPPWSKTSDAEYLLTQCEIMVKNYFVIIPGWSLQNVKCSATGAVGEWIRTYGGLYWINRMAEVDPFLKNAEINVDVVNGKALTKVALSQTPVVNSEPIYDISQIMKNLTDLVISIKVRATLSINKEDIKVPKDVEEAAKKLKVRVDPITYNLVRFSITSRNLPTTWAEIFRKIGGLTLESVTWNNNSREWSFEGKIYSKLDKKPKLDEAKADDKKSKTPKKKGTK